MRFDGDSTRLTDAHLARRYLRVRLRRAGQMMTIALMASVLILPVAQAKLYKWVDENGNVSYSQQKPPDAAAQAIELRGFESADPDAGAKLKEAQDESDVQRKDQEFAAQEGDATKEREERLKKNCEIARQNARILKNSSRVKATSDSGESYFLDDAAVSARLEKTQKQIEDFCQ